MSTEFQQIHLIMEWGGPPPAGWPVPLGASRVFPQASALGVPSKLSWLVCRAGRSPMLAVVKSGRAANSFLVEPVMQRRQLRLLLVCAGKRRVRVNGLAAPRLVVLKEKDCVQLDEDVLLHVTVFNRPSIGPVPAGFIGKECPVCRVPFAENIIAYSCSCGAALHCEGDGIEDGLQCAQLRAVSGCPACQRPVVLKEGYSYLPEVTDE